MSVTLESAERINALKTAIEAVTGTTYTDLTQGVQALKDGYGQSSGGGVEYTDIIYNDDDTVTLIDKKGTEHTIACEFDNNRIISMTYDGTEVAVIYDGDELVSVGETEVNVANATLDNSLEVLIDQSGVLDSTEGTVEEKVGELIDRADLYKQCQTIKFTNNTSITRIDVYIDKPNADATSMFSGTTNLKFMVGVNTSIRANVADMYKNSGIEVIQEPFDFSKVTNWQQATAFNNANHLREIRFLKETLRTGYNFGSPYLSADSIRSIFVGLSSERANTLTIPRNAVKKAFETSEGANDGDTSETWNDLVASKPNWTITLS